MAKKSTRIQERLSTLRRKVEGLKMEGYIAANPSNVAYLTGYKDPGGASQLLLAPLDGEPTLFVPVMNSTQVESETRGCTIIPIKAGEKMGVMVSSKLGELGLRRVLHDGLPPTLTKEIRGQIKKRSLRPDLNLLSEMRSVKDEEEVRSIKRASAFSDLGAQAAMDAVKEGVREYEVAAEAEYAIRRKGAEGFAFQTIVASGPRSSWPHGGCGPRRLRRGDAVVIDLGGVYEGYCSDLTRTVFVGGPSEKARRVYRVVAEAQREALEGVRVGMGGEEADLLARGVVERGGFGEYFSHGLGHGVGLEVHEHPRLGPKSPDRLVAGNVVTVEPGVYLPNRFGVRIEDTALLTEGGLRLLTRCEKPSY